MVLKKLREYLDAQKVRYTAISHSPAYTAQEIATTAHIPGKELAKTVMVKADGKMLMAVVPASDMVDFRLLRSVLGASAVSLATETEFKGMFPECEVGAMPPFGNLYDMQVLVSDDLARDEEIAFNAGDHRELMKLAYRDFERLVSPKVVRISARKVSAEEHELHERV